MRPFNVYKLSHDCRGKRTKKEGITKRAVKLRS